jgi:hypothetical protein
VFEIQPEESLTIVNEYLKQETIEHMDWPAKSPDLNPIEHGWDILQHRISNRQNQPNSLQELSDALVDEWSRILTKQLKCHKMSTV